MKTRIYALRDNHWIRYVGKTIKSLEERLSGHMKDARDKNNKNYKCNWIRTMLLRGQIPRITLIEEVEGDGNEEEIKWIKFFRKGGVNLTNITGGGQGHPHTKESRLKISNARKGKGVGWHHTPEARAKMSISRRGHFVSIETRQKVSAAQRGVKDGPLPFEQRQKISESLKGQIPWCKGKRIYGRKGSPHSEEHKRKIGLANKGHTVSPETRLKVSQALKGKPKSIEHRAKLSDALKGRKLSPEVRLHHIQAMGPRDWHGRLQKKMVA